jgi:predicted dehydrogenase
MMNSSKAGQAYTAVVIGLGKIGMGYDMQLDNRDYVLSHVRALQFHRDFFLVAAVDPDPKLRQDFTALIGQPAYARIDDLLAQHRPEIIVVASPTSSHRKVLDSVLDCYHPRVILCEKPLAVTADDAKGMVAACREAGVPLLVNFIRRADPGVQEARRRIVDGSMRGPFKGVAWYSKGVLHNGSHFVDLLSYWLGPIRSFRLITMGRSIGENDAEPDFELDYEMGTVIFCAVREEDFSHYTVEIVARNGRMRYERGGELLWQGVEDDANLAGYRRLSATTETFANDTNKYQLHVAEQLSRALRGKSHALCDGEQAAGTMIWLERLIQELNSERIKNE